MANRFWKGTGRWLPGLLISLIAIAAILYFVDLDALVEAVRLANYWLLLGGVAISLLWLPARSLVWRTLLQNKASFKHVFLTVCEGYLLNSIFPFRLGEIGRAFLLNRKSGIPFMEVLPTIVIERVLDLAMSAAVLLIAVPFVVGAAGAETVALIMGGLVVLGLAGLYFLARYREGVMRWFEKVSQPRPRLQAAGNFLNSFFTGLGVLTNGWLFLRVLIYMIINWAVAILQFFLFILAFFPEAQPIWAFFGLGAAAFGAAVPSLPGAVGTYEGAFGGALTLLSGDSATALAAALTAHLLGYLTNIIFGVIAFSTEGETVLGVYQQLRRRQDAGREEKE